MKIQLPESTSAPAGAEKIRASPSVIAASLVLTMVATGLLWRLGPTWIYMTNGLTATAVLIWGWEIQRQRTLIAMRTARQIAKLLEVLRSAKTDLSSEERRVIESELESLRVDVLRRASLHR